MSTDPEIETLRRTLPELPQPYRALARACLLEDRLREAVLGPGLPRELAADIDCRLRAIDALLDAEARRFDHMPGDTVVLQTPAGQRLARVATVGEGTLTVEGDPALWPRLAVIRNHRTRPEAPLTEDRP
jgi:hypothetical protein